MQGQRRVTASSTGTNSSETKKYFIVIQASGQSVCTTVYAGGGSWGVGGHFLNILGNSAKLVCMSECPL